MDSSYSNVNLDYLVDLLDLPNNHDLKLDEEKIIINNKINFAAENQTKFPSRKIKNKIVNLSLCGSEIFLKIFKNIKTVTKTTEQEINIKNNIIGTTQILIFDKLKNFTNLPATNEKEENNSEIKVAEVNLKRKFNQAFGQEINSSNSDTNLSLNFPPNKKFKYNSTQPTLNNFYENK